MNTTQRLADSTLERLRKLGKMGDSFDDVLDKVLDRYEHLEKRVTEIEEDLDEEEDE